MDKEKIKSSDPLTTKKFAPTNSLSLCCSNSSLPLSFGRFDLEMYPLFIINENFHLAKKRKKKKSCQGFCKQFLHEHVVYNSILPN